MLNFWTCALSAVLLAIEIPAFAQIEPMVPNVPETYRMASNTLILLIGGLVVLIVVLVLAWKVVRRRTRAS